MKKILRLTLSIITTFLFFFMSSCARVQNISAQSVTSNTPTETITLVSNDSVSQTDLFTSVIETTTTCIDSIEVSAEETTTILDQTTHTETSTIVKPEPTVSTRTQNGIEICSDDSDFQISESSIQKLNSIYASYPGTNIAWGLYSLKDDSFISFNKDVEFTSCSTIKVVYSLYCLEQVKARNASLDDILVYDKTKHHYNSTTASKSTIAKLGRSEFTLKEVIYYTLYVSDNDAYMMLLYYFGFDDFNDYVASLGSSTELNFSMLYGHATVENRAKEWKQIYSFYNEDNEVSEFFKTTLLDAKYGYIEEGLLSLGYNTAHKSGWSDKYGAAHDCAIVYSQNGEYLMIILTQKYNSTPQKALVKNLAPVLDEIWSNYNC